jgi:hypothetical protein
MSNKPKFKDHRGRVYNVIDNNGKSFKEVKKEMLASFQRNLQKYPNEIVFLLLKKNPPLFVTGHMEGIPRSQHVLARQMLQYYIDQYGYESVIISTEETPNVLPELNFDAV